MTIHAVIEIHSRDEMIAFGNSIGRACKYNKRKRPWVILFNGDVDSGKSLIALAINQVFYPEAYSDGIPTCLSVDRELRSSCYRKPYQKVAFRQFAREKQPTKEGFDESLTRYCNNNKKALVLTASNLIRQPDGVFSDAYDYEKYGLNSNVLDMHICVHRVAEKYTTRAERFFRKIGLTYADPRLTPLPANFPPPPPKSLLTRLLSL